LNKVFFWQQQEKSMALILFLSMGFLTLTLLSETNIFQVAWEGIVLNGINFLFNSYWGLFV